MQIIGRKTLHRRSRKATTSMLELYSNSKGYGVKNLPLYVLDLVCLTSLLLFP